MQTALISHNNIRMLQKSKMFKQEICECMREWLVDSKLSIHFGEDKTKCVFSAFIFRLLKINVSTFV